MHHSRGCENKKYRIAERNKKNPQRFSIQLKTNPTRTRTILTASPRVCEQKRSVVGPEFDVGFPIGSAGLTGMEVGSHLGHSSQGVHGAPESPEEWSQGSLDRELDIIHSCARLHFIIAQWSDTLCGNTKR